MMITIRLSLDDMWQLRFGYSPLMQLAISYRTLTMPLFQNYHQLWVQKAKSRLRDVALPYLDSVMWHRHYIPHFLTPPPQSTSITLDEELEQLLHIPEERIRADVQILFDKKRSTSVSQAFLNQTDKAIHRLVDELRLYWTRALADDWSRITTILEGDMLYRAKQLATQGAETMFNDLDANLTFATHHIQIHTANENKEYHLQGKGLQLVPLIFRGCHNFIYWQITDEWQPMIAYTARGIGIWSQQTDVKAGTGLERALSSGRARILQAVRIPTTTTEIAQRLGITAGAASQQVSRLKQAGLIQSHRDGKRIYHHLTPRGKQLLVLFELPI